MKNTKYLGYSAAKAMQIYESMTDKQLLKFAERNAKTLRPDVLPVLLAELDDRHIGKSLVYDIKHKSGIFLLDLKKIEDKIQEIKSIKCPRCKLKARDISCEVYHIITGVFIKHFYATPALILCKDCHRKIARQYIASNLTLGWWSMYGLLVTPYALSRNFWSQFASEKSRHQNMVHYVIDYQEALFYDGLDLQKYIEEENKNVANK